MAKKSKIARNEQRKVIVERYAARRTELRAVLNDPDASPDEKQLASFDLTKLPGASRPTRVRNRCSMSGRPRGHVRKFGLSRIAFRDMALEGKIPGVRKSSW